MTPLARLAAPALTLALVACATPGGSPRSAAPPPPAARPAGDAGHAAAPEVDPLLREARRLLEASQYERAEELLVRASRLAPADPRPLVQRAEVRLAARDPAAAADVLERAIALEETAEARALRGRALGLARRYDAAAVELERALALDGAHRLALSTLTAVHLCRGDEAAMRRAHGLARAALGRDAATDGLTVQLHALAPARVAAEEALDRCTRGWAALVDGDFAYATNEMLVGLRHAPRFVWCMAGLGEAMWRSGQPAQGEELLRAVIPAYPERDAGLRADAQARLAELLVDTGRAGPEALGLVDAALATRGPREALVALRARAAAPGGGAAR